MIKTLLVLASILLAGCAATQLEAGAQQVRIFHEAPHGCHYLGVVTGNQGNSFTGGWTSNSNLEAGAMNSLRNQAKDMGGNTVVLMTNRAGQTGSYSMYGGGTRETNVTMTGTVYNCPQAVLDQ